MESEAGEGGSDAVEESGEVEDSDAVEGSNAVESEDGREVSDGDDHEVSSEEVVGEEGTGNEVDIAPASPTYMWTPAGVACARCSGEVERLWRCGGQLVCGGCKEW